MLLEKVLEDAGVTDPDVEIDFITTDGFEYGVVSLQTAREQAYLVTYLVNEAPFWTKINMEIIRLPPSAFTGITMRVRIGGTA